MVLGRREGVVARVRVSLEAFRRGELPAVCAMTGERADRLMPVNASYTPRWTWLLLPFGGVMAFLIGRGFARREMTGLVPFSGNGLARARARRRRGLATVLVAAFVVMLIVYRASWLSALIVGAAPIAILFGWLSAGVVGGGTVGAQLDPDDGTVVLWGVHESFKHSARPDPNLRLWQPR